jgi:membrane protein
MRHRLVTPLLEVQRAYDRGGGGMLTASLAFFAFFTILPTLLLFTSVLGFFVEDATTRSRMIDSLVGQLEPLAEVADAIVKGLADNARTGTIIGLLGLLWGAAGFYGALEGSMQRMFPGPGQRDVVVIRVRGVISVALVLTGMLAAVAATVLVPLLSVDLGDQGMLVTPLIACAVAVAACLVVYVAVPPDGPGLRAAWLPALVAGAAIGLLTTLFGSLAPFIVASYLALGIVGSVFVALVWLNLVFQILLYGAAYARLRRDAERRRDPPRL